MSPLETLRKLFEEMMSWHGEELMPVDFVMSSVLTGFLPGAVEKAWGDLRGGPSTGKSELLGALKDGNQRVKELDNWTENSFSSKYRDPKNPDKDFSLLYDLSSSSDPKGPKILIISEFSTVATMRKDKRDKMVSDLRQAYGGYYSSHGANTGLTVNSDLQFGLVVAGTEALDDLQRDNQSLGQRTLICRMAKDFKFYKARQVCGDRIGKLSRVQKAALRVRIRMTTRKALDKAIAHARVTMGTIEIAPEFQHRVRRLGTVATSVRTCPVSRGRYASQGEGPARVIQQFMAWGDAHAIFDERDHWVEEDYQLLRRIAQDTMLPENLRAINVMWRGSAKAAIRPMTCDEIRAKAMCDGDFYRQLKQWEIIGIVYAFGDGQYGLNPDFARDIEYTGFTKGL